jgi:hypothetical protein
VNTPANFAIRALSPERTIEEVYFAERAVETSVAAWKSAR